MKKARARKVTIDYIAPIVTFRRDTIECDMTPIQTRRHQPPKPTILEYSNLQNNSKRKRVQMYAKKVRDFIEDMLKADGLGEGTNVEVLDVLASSIKLIDPLYQRYTDDIKQRVHPKPTKIEGFEGLVSTLIQNSTSVLSLEP